MQNLLFPAGRAHTRKLPVATAHRYNKLNKNKIKISDMHAMVVTCIQYHLVFSFFIGLHS